jgi:tRNA-dihydrouridine synthase
VQLDIAKSLEQAGADAIGVHARQVHERPVDSAHWEALAPVVSSLSVPVLANGDIFVRDDIDKVRETSGASSVMIARGALNNPSIFREQGLLPSTEVFTVLRSYSRADELLNVVCLWSFCVGRRRLPQDLRRDGKLVPKHQVHALAYAADEMRSAWSPDRDSGRSVRD